MNPTLKVTFSKVVNDPWEGEVVCTFGEETSPPKPLREGLSARDYREVRWYVEEFLGLPESGNLRRASDVERRLYDFGRNAWEEIRCPTADRWLEMVRAAGEGQLELRVNEPSDRIAFRSPWERMHPGGTDGASLCQLGVSIVRCIDGLQSRSPSLLPGHGPAGVIRVLYIVCRPEDMDFLDPRHTPSAVLDALENSAGVVTDFCYPSALSGVRRALQRAASEGRPYHVVHFDGHGMTLPREGGVSALCFEDVDGRLDLVQAHEFGAVLARHSVALVILEACRTATPADTHETLASDLIRHGIRAVIAMSHAVHVDLTRMLVKSIYSSIAKARAVGRALADARRDVEGCPRRQIGVARGRDGYPLQDWFVPQLYLGASDFVLSPTASKVVKKLFHNP